MVMDFILGEYLEIPFGYVKLGLPIQYKNENVERAVEYKSPEFRREFWCRHRNLGVSSILENHETGREKGLRRREKSSKD